MSRPRRVTPRRPGTTWQTRLAEPARPRPAREIIIRARRAASGQLG
jgi:hypothetical protein